ncbi:hypothetical protein T265_02907 [Opisthorchis viverrini]|uniref:polynucleotide adenylyltransferase n=1 Tax=Opisthorchis viverrini TaxID=6198 RepID=A0A075AHZ9_OPIVI|nr:hypothetical protein T265_02907 [Opisthorchis viverrini]KER30764.1 hypothetical protein T265_02907 [Opisthorchis viverrini]
MAAEVSSTNLRPSLRRCTPTPADACRRCFCVGTWFQLSLILLSVTVTKFLLFLLMGSKPGDEIPPQCLGETGALSFKKPTEQDLKDSQELETTLAQLDIFETPEEITQRREALMRLQEISNKWIKQKAVEQNLPPHVAKATTGKIFTFGSYRLGVNFKGADVDSLLVVPRFITRQEFFSEFQSVLSENPHVEDIHAVVDAFVPVLKLKFMGVEIDLLFAQIDQMNIAENFNLCENTEVLMRNMDEHDVRSINGVRVNEDILNLVYNKNSFKVALKKCTILYTFDLFLFVAQVIRFWAKRRNIYSNTLGFLGGVSWAILVSRICQLYPYASPSMLVYLFFKIFSQWPWPKPVRLRESEYIPSLCLPVWDPRLNLMDQYHLMPILTPSYPSQNSAYNVQRSNRIILERELKQGLTVSSDALLHKQPWSNLFEPAFFFRYRHYVVVIVTGSAKRSFLELCGLVESRLRVLVSNFELNRYVKIAHVNCRSYGKGPSDEDAELVRKWFIGMEFDRNPNSLTTVVNHTCTEKPTLNVDLSENINSFEKSIERGLSNDDLTNTVTVKYVKKSQLHQFVSAEDMDEIKRQAAKAAISETAKASESSKASPYPSVGSDRGESMPSPASSSDLPSGAASPASLQRSSSCASVVNVTLQAASPSQNTASSDPQKDESAVTNGSSYPENSISTETSNNPSPAASNSIAGPSQSSPDRGPLAPAPAQKRQSPAKNLSDSSGDDVKRKRLTVDNTKLVLSPPTSAR